MRNPGLPKKKDFEKTIGGKKTHLFVLRNTNGAFVAVTDYGARIVGIWVPDKHGNLVDVALGYKHIDDYIEDDFYFGAIIGRYANRIAKGEFYLNDTLYKVSPNSHGHALHGGTKGYHNRVWDRRQSFEQNSIDFYLVSPDGDEGFPGELNIWVNYTLTDDNELIISYRAHADQDTVLNLTNHTYFNLNGEGKGDILNHHLKINSSRYLDIDEQLIPTGKIHNVDACPFDFREFKTIGKDMQDSNLQIKLANGYDHTYINDQKDGKALAEVFSPETGIKLKVFTTQAGLQLYTSNGLDCKKPGKSNVLYGAHSAFCLETQHYPDSPNRSEFPSTLLKKGDEFTSKTIYKFSFEGK